LKIEDEIQQKKFKDDYQKLVVNLLYTSNWMNAHFESFFKGTGITLQQYNVLRILRGQYPNPSSVKLIRERMLDRMSDASRIVDKLVQKKLVIRKQCSNDRRSVDVVISESGLTLLQSLEVLDEKSKELLKFLSKTEISTLNSLLDKLRS
jgi:DNA-binding MarR family transcriptional regulator